MSIRTARDGQPTGIWELEALQAAVDSGEVQPTDLVWTKGFQDWKKLSEVAEEIRISLPMIAEGVPPLPGASAQVPPIPSAPPSTESSARSASAHDLGELKFRKRSDRKNYGFRASTKIIFLLLLLVGGWLLATHGLPWLKGRLQVNPNPVSETNSGQETVAIGGSNIEVSETGIRDYVRSLDGRLISLHAKDGDDRDVSIYINKGALFHCGSRESKNVEACVAETRNRMGVLSYEQVNLSGITSYCMQAGYDLRPRAQFSQAGAICIANQKIEGMSGDGEPDTRWHHSIPTGMPFYAFAVRFNDERPTLAYFRLGSSISKGNSQPTENDAASTQAESSDGNLQAEQPGDGDDLTCLLLTNKLKEYENASRSGDARAAMMASVMRSNRMQEDACNNSHTQQAAISQAQCPIPDSENSEPIACSKAPPMYPPYEARLGIQGTTAVIVSIATSGAVLNVEVEESSGSRNLDRAAVQAVRQWRFSPEIKDGKRVASRVRIPVTFGLQDAEQNADVSALTSSPAVSETTPSHSSTPERRNAQATGFAVQIGTFLHAEAATSLRDSLRGAGFDAFTDSVPGGIRVRVGPVDSQAEANDLNAKVKARLGIEGVVRPNP